MKCKFSVGETKDVHSVCGAISGRMILCAGEDKDKAACPIWSHSGRKFKVE